MADVGGSNSSGSAAIDGLGSRQQGGSSADPWVDAIESCLPHMYVFPCVSCTGIKLALAHTLYVCPGASCMIELLFTHVCQGAIWTIYHLHTYLCCPGWDLYDLRDLDYFLFSGVICMVCGIWIMFSGWDLYDLALAHMFTLAGSVWSRSSHTFAWVGSAWSAWSAHVCRLWSVRYAESRSYFPDGICMI